MPAVVRTRVGYCGGTLENPTYHNLGDHTEAIQVDYDPTKMTFVQILELIWKSHNPCRSSWSRQYMSAIFYESEGQKKAIEAGRASIEAELGSPVKTSILPLTRFYVAEDYHQKYELRCQADLIQEFKAMYPEPKDLMNSTAAARVNGYLAGQGSAKELKADLDLLGLSEEGKKRLQIFVR